MEYPNSGRSARLFDAPGNAKMKPVIAWETITGFRGGEGRNYVSRELWELERLTLNSTPLIG